MFFPILAYPRAEPLRGRPSNSPRFGIPKAVFPSGTGQAFRGIRSLTGRCHVGLLVGERFVCKDLGAIGYLMRNSRTVGDALRALLFNLHLHDRGAVPVLIKLDSASVLLGYSIYRHGMPATAQMYDAAIAIAFRMLRELCGPTWRPLAVHFSHQRPDNVRPYHRLLGPNLRFDADISGIAFASSWLGKTVAGADPALHELISRALTQALANRSVTFSEQVQGVLHQMLLSGTSSAEEVAHLFGIHERTLRKRLRAERTTLHRLISQTRFELARQLLSNTRLSASEIADTLRYADLSTFSRAFKTWANVSPQQYRRMH